MSLRTPRRRFATPFVVTLAAIPACTSASSHATLAPSEPEPAAVEASAATPSGGEFATPTPPAKNPPKPHKNPPEPEPDPGPPPAKFEQRWTVAKIKGNPECSANLVVTCPQPQPGKPTPTCNPPPPIKYACPAGLADGDTIKIILRVGATECFVDYGPLQCPAGAKCNPPPPRKLPCPVR